LIAPHFLRIPFSDKNLTNKTCQGIRHRTLAEMSCGDRLLAGHASPDLSCASDEATDGFIATMIIKNFKFELKSNNHLNATMFVH